MPKVERANNAGATIGGIVAAILVEIALPLVLFALSGAAQSAVTYRAGVPTASPGAGIYATLAVGSVLLAIVAPVVALVVLVSNKREKPQRAFAFAFLMTTVASIGAAVLLLAGLFVACLIGISAYQHH